ncbi:c-type cytochrome [Hymenobacter nivis]|uniref:Cytochrome c class I n=1 Tax=Hymenobacter nivis TaxID=1850093 RepID=A0A502GK99_9BACT|nr:c-type cytochrome [Hymenobacter nivis]TPG61790.1 cytochrome c class I [Hymenobacter nivis]
MKKIALLLSSCALLIACESAPKATETAATEPAAGSGAPTAVPASAAGAGASLIATSDCAGCHKEHDKVVGPAYAAIAAKYQPTEANITMLANKIITGGKGNWGEIPMTPHPGLSVADAQEMTKYILSVK